MENVTDVYTGPCSPESRYIKPFSVHYKQVSVACTDKRYRAAQGHRARVDGVAPPADGDSGRRRVSQ